MTTLSIDPNIDGSDAFSEFHGLQARGANRHPQRRRMAGRCLEALALMPVSRAPLAGILTVRDHSSKVREDRKEGTWGRASDERPAVRGRPHWPLVGKPFPRRKGTCQPVNLAEEQEGGERCGAGHWYGLDHAYSSGPCCCSQRCRPRRNRSTRGTSREPSPWRPVRCSPGRRSRSPAPVLVSGTRTAVSGGGGRFVFMSLPRGALRSDGLDAGVQDDDGNGNRPRAWLDRRRPRPDGARPVRGDGHGDLGDADRRHAILDGRHDVQRAAAREDSDRPQPVLRPGADGSGHVCGRGRASRGCRARRRTAAPTARTSPWSTASTPPTRAARRGARW